MENFLGDLHEDIVKKSVVITRYDELLVSVQLQISSFCNVTVRPSVTARFWEFGTIGK